MMEGRGNIDLTLGTMSMKSGIYTAKSFWMSATLPSEEEEEEETSASANSRDTGSVTEVLMYSSTCGSCWKASMLITENKGRGCWQEHNVMNATVELS